MNIFPFWIAFCGAAAGMINGLFGAGGGLLLVPMLEKSTDFSGQEVFPASISIILPLCIVTLTMGASNGLPWKDALPYLIGSAAGGVAAGYWGKHIPQKWLHRALGILILWGGWRLLW